MKTGRQARCDYEYERNGVANLFMIVRAARRPAPRQGNGSRRELCSCLEGLADVHFAAAKVIGFASGIWGIPKPCVHKVFRYSMKH